MNRRWIAVAGIAVLALAGLWFFFLRSDNPAPVSLEAAVDAVTDTTSLVEEALPEAPPETVEEDPVDAGLDGTWTVLSDENSFAGYRVGEELGGIGVTEAVGRTSNVTGTLELEGATLTNVEVGVDMTSLQSDDTRRDGAMGRQALETGAFPTASFVLTETLDLGAVPQDGEEIRVTAIGDLTLHGVTRNLEMTLEAQLVGDRIIVVGTADLNYGLFDIELPSAPILVGVDDHGLIELQLTFSRP